MGVLDDGTVTYVYERLEIGLRPVPDEELNRRYASYSDAGAESTNPYTYGNWIPRGEQAPPQRFTVFFLRVKNYTYPKMLVDPYTSVLLSQNGREYGALDWEFLREYYTAFVVGYAGDAAARYEERKDLLRKTLYPVESIFSGQQLEGFVVFPVLHEDVREVTVRLQGIVLRFDSWGKPLETLELNYRFRRDVQVIRSGS